MELTVTHEHRKRIQEMVATGKISPDESLELLEALDRGEPIEPELMPLDFHEQYTGERLDVGMAINDSFEVYFRNLLTFVAANFVGCLIMIASLFTLTGPVLGGLSRLSVRTLLSRDRHARFEYFWEGFHRFFNLVFLFPIVAFAVLVGTVVGLGVGGLVVMGLFMYAFHFVAMRHLSLGDSLGESWAMAKKHGIVNNSIVATLLLAMWLVPGIVPINLFRLGFILLVLPILHCFVASAWLQQAGPHFEMVNGKKPMDPEPIPAPQPMVDETPVTD